MPDPNTPPPGTPEPLPGNNPPNEQADLIENYISENKVMLTNSLLPDVWAKLQNRGYTQAIIQQKIGDLDTLSKLNEAQRKEYGEQYQSTAKYTAAEDLPHGDYEDHLGYARLVFKNDKAAQTALALKGKRHRSQAGYAAQALTFYNNLLGSTAWKTAIATKGVTAAELTAQQAAYAGLAALEAAQAKETGEAQASTKTRDAAHETLRPWLKEFRATVKIALRRFPQLSEQLGIRYRS